MIKLLENGPRNMHNETVVLFISNNTVFRQVSPNMGLLSTEPVGQIINRSAVIFASAHNIILLIYHVYQDCTKGMQNQNTLQIRYLSYPAITFQNKQAFASNSCGLNDKKSVNVTIY